MRCLAWSRHLWTAYSWGTVAALAGASLCLPGRMSAALLVKVVFLALMAMIARQLPLMKGGLVVSTEWAVYFAGALHLSAVGAGWVPFLAIAGLQAITVLQRRSRLPGQRRTLLEEAAAGASRAGLGIMGAVALVRGVEQAPPLEWSSGGRLAVGCWLACLVLLGFLEALAGSLRYRVGLGGELRRYLGEMGPAWLLALPGGLLLHVLLELYGTTTVVATLVVLLAMLLLYTLLVFADMQGAYWDTVHTLVQTMESRDQASPGEGQRGACLAAALARKLHLPEARVQAIYLGALLRDIGLVGLDESLAGRGGVLPAPHYYRVWDHAVIGGRILERLPRMKGAALAIRHHHERWDGTGYPAGLAGGQIPLEARVVALADAYVAMTSDRPFRRAMSREQAWEEVARGRGTQFDPGLVPPFGRVVAEEACWGRHAFWRHYAVLPRS